ncbi:MAG: hypothetical protein LUG66_04965 [Clostridiales bacterium]|nr:hypothetical protein [Clostridiales bacterium]
MNDVTVIDKVLKRDGLSVDKLEKLSYASQLGINLKKNLHYFDKEALFEGLAPQIFV